MLIAVSGPMHRLAEKYGSVGALVWVLDSYLVIDRAALNPEINPRNLRRRYQVIDARENLVGLYRGRKAAEREANRLDNLRLAA